MGDELSLGDARKGLVLGAFGLGYVVTTFLGGMIVERYGPRRVFFVLVLLWGISAGATGLATSFALLYGARVMLGLAEGPSFPAVGSAIGSWLPRCEHTRALSAAMIAVPIALAIGAPISTALIGTVGWRGMFLLLAIASLLWLPLWWWLFRDSPREHPRLSP